ncbi:hypothetical protein CXG81DRAFT_20032 [Caulochytrium protostelioides]|uniref:Uncharacterized protein n=1 Tax=Caulochytrium protostelioides TaxID=1555241 RepID=A0A4P9X4H5_9FUNG|nr:hypothetical protein CXG81DRAFT_20032 [Caulochytrium protostelioides]|eukprot:RKO99941.1 hypothetical protein CXG81DRAFT_20032 [Caulochytrium protostelioides]
MVAVARPVRGTSRLPLTAMLLVGWSMMAVLGSVAVSASSLAAPDAPQKASAATPPPEGHTITVTVKDTDPNNPNAVETRASWPLIQAAQLRLARRIAVDPVVGAYLDGLAEPHPATGVAPLTADQRDVVAAYLAEPDLAAHVAHTWGSLSTHLLSSVESKIAMLGASVRDAHDQQTVAGLSHTVRQHLAVALQSHPSFAGTDTRAVFRGLDHEHPPAQARARAAAEAPLRARPSLRLDRQHLHQPFEPTAMPSALPPARVLQDKPRGFSAILAATVMVHATSSISMPPHVVNVVHTAPAATPVAATEPAALAIARGQALQPARRLRRVKRWFFYEPYYEPVFVSYWDPVPISPEATIILFVLVAIILVASIASGMMYQGRRTRVHHYVEYY